MTSQLTTELMAGKGPSITEEIEIGLDTENKWDLSCELEIESADFIADYNDENRQSTMKQRMYNSLPLLQDLVPLNYHSTNELSGNPSNCFFVNANS